MTPIGLWAALQLWPSLLSTVQWGQRWLGAGGGGQGSATSVCPGPRSIPSMPSPFLRSPSQLTPRLMASVCPSPAAWQSTEGPWCQQALVSPQPCYSQAPSNLQAPTPQTLHLPRAGEGGAGASDHAWCVPVRTRPCGGRWPACGRSTPSSRRSSTRCAAGLGGRLLGPIVARLTVPFRPQLIQFLISLVQSNRILGVKRKM